MTAGSQQNSAGHEQQLGTIRCPICGHEDRKWLFEEGGYSIWRCLATMMGEGPAVREDKMSISLGFADGSVGTVNYFANGLKSYPKETLEAFSDRRVLKLDNFRRLRGYGVKGFRKFKTSRQDKGHAAGFATFVDRVASGGEQLIPFEQLDNVTRATFAAKESARTHKTIEL